MNMHHQKISLYVPCFNVEQFIDDCLEGVLTQTYSIDEILIIDDGSRDDTVEIARRYPVKIIEHSSNKGLAAARNTAICHASNELVASLDADCVPSSTWLENLLPLLEDSKTGAVGGKLVETALHCTADYWRRSHLRQDWGGDRVYNPSFVFGNNNIVRKSVVLSAGGYDESMRTNGEDADISNRMRTLGYKLIYEPKAIVNHKRQDTLLSILDTYWRYWRFGAKAYLGESSVQDLLRHNVRHWTVDLGKAMYRDIKEKNYSLLWVDLLLPCYMTMRDITTYQNQKKTN